MPRHPRKEKSAIAVAVLASLAFLFAAVFVYEVPGKTIVHYLLVMLILMLAVMALAACLVGIRVLIRKLVNRQ